MEELIMFILQILSFTALLFRPWFNWITAEMFFEKYLRWSPVIYKSFPFRFEAILFMILELKMI